MRSARRQHPAPIGRAVRQIRKGEHSKRSWQEEDFLGKGALYPHWKEYLNNLFFADGEFHNPSNVEDFINEETVIDAGPRPIRRRGAPGSWCPWAFWAR